MTYGYTKEQRTELRHRERVLEEVHAERTAQQDKWGMQDHPCIREDSIYGIAPERIAKEQCDERFRDGKGSWLDIAIEELAEAHGAKTDEERREELVQMAAVCVAWVQAIDRRHGKES